MDIDEDEIMEHLREMVLLEEKVISFNYLSNRFLVPVKKTQEIMMRFKEQMEKDGRKDEIIATFAISGYGKDDTGESDDPDKVRVLKLWQVDESDLQSVREELFAPNSSVTIKFLRKQHILLNDAPSYPPNNRLVVQDQADLEKSQSLYPVVDKTLTIRESAPLLFHVPEQVTSGVSMIRIAENKDVKKDSTVEKDEVVEVNDTEKVDDDDDEMDFKYEKVNKDKGDEDSDMESDREEEEENVDVDAAEKDDDDDDDDEEVVKPKKRRRVVLHDSDTDEEPVTTKKKSKPPAKGKAGKKVPAKQKEDSASENDNDDNDGELVFIPKGKADARKAKAALARIKKEEELSKKEQEKERKKNGKVIAGDIQLEEMVEVEEEFVDEDGFTQTRVTKKLQPIPADVLKARKEAENLSQNSQKAEKAAAKSQPKSNANGKSKSSSQPKGRQAPVPSKKITDFFSRPAK